MKSVFFLVLVVTTINVCENKSVTWTFIADSLLCSSDGNANDIRAGLSVVDPSANWIVIVYTGTAYWDTKRGETHNINKCGHKMVVWKGDAPSSVCNEETKTKGQAVIDYWVNSAMEDLQEKLNRIKAGKYLEMLL